MWSRAGIRRPAGAGASTTALPPPGWPDGRGDLELEFARWRDHLRRRPELRQPDAEELEDHLRGSVDELVAVGLRPDEAFLVPCGAVAEVVAGWLVEAKRSVVENIAPVRTRLFTPLFTAVMLASSSPRGDRHRHPHRGEALILFNLLLIVVLGLLLYSVSTRDPLAPPGLFDNLQLALVVNALIIDVLVLLEIAGRIAEYGTAPNKAAALGENVILLANLAWSAWLVLGFLRRRAPFTTLERWQTGYLPVYAVWAWIVTLAFPPLFGYL